MNSTNQLAHWLTGLNRYAYGALIGGVIGLTGGIIAVLVAVGGPIVAFAVIFGVLAGLYVLSNVTTALYGVILVTGLIPFGTLPFKIGITPTFLDLALGAFLLVYAMQWMTGRRQGFRLTPIHALVVLYALWLILAFALGLRYAPFTSATIRQFAETLLSIGLVFVLGDLIREPQTLRRLVIAIMAAVGMQAVVAIVLYILPDQTAEELLVRLARFGYPNGGVIRFIEDNPANAERAIGTWVDPNALGGILAVSAALVAPQLFSRKPVLPYRWLTLGVLGVIALALLLTFSRASMLAFAISLFIISLFPGYRKYLPMLVLGAVLIIALPQTRTYVERFTEAFTGADLATQMRIGEYTDSLELISRNPIVGVGFTGTPEIDLYTNVASMYLIMANQIGLVGVGLFGIVILGVLIYGWRARRNNLLDPQMASIHLGYHAALIAALINATADLYFFRMDFQGSILFFWLIITLALASSRLLNEMRESTVAKAA
ncbi:MAG: O-antigen ligase family protein [Chloroflexi bacterium]|nr:O-antigen ligase family protein [Chloroflexota bacterium]MCC6893565.1 O-antigen ligase family protein [Anaerolineae bacterium]